MAKDFFGNLGQALSKTAKELSGRAEDVYETQRLKNKISAEERQIDKIMADLGKIVYQRYKEEVRVDDAQKALCEQIDHTDIRHVKQIAIIKIATLHLCVHAVETSLHAVRTYMYIIRKIDHLSCLTLGTVTEGTELLRFIIIGLIICILIFFLYDLIIVFICHINSFHLQRFATSLICKTHRLMAPVPAHLPMRSL